MHGAPVPSPRPRRWRRRLLFLFVVLALLAFFAPAIAARTGVVQKIVNGALADFDGSASVGSCSLGWLAPVELTDVALKDAQGRTLLAAPKVTTSKTLVSFLLDRGNLGTVTVERPSLEIVCENGTTNLEASLKKMLEAPGGAAKPRVTIALADATLTVKDAEQKKEWTFGGIAATADLGDTTHVAATVATPQPLELDASFGERVAATLKTERFPFDAVGPFLRRFEPGLAVAGSLTGRVTTTGDVIDGDVSVRDFAATSPRLGSERITLAQFSLPFKLETNGATLRVESAKLACDLGEATFAGTLDTRAMEKLLQQPGLSATAKIEIAKLAKMLPTLLRLKPGTELQQGHVEMALASKPASNGALWEGNLKTSALRGTRGGQPLHWDQPIAASFAGRIDARFRPEFERLAVTSDFATITARGRLGDFSADAVVSLDALAKHLAEFVDLSGVTLAGTAKFGAAGKPDGTATAISATLRLNNFIASSKDWRVAARGDLAGQARFDEKTVNLKNLVGTLENVAFRGFGLDLDEPNVNLLPTEVTYDRTAGKLAIPRLQATTRTLSVGAENVAIADDGITFRAATNVDLGRLQQALKLGGDPLAGRVNNGIVDFRAAGGKSRVNLKLPIVMFTWGPPANATWQEPALTLALAGEYDPKADAFAIESATLERPDGVTVSAAGRVTQLATKQTVDLAGELRYDLAAIEPQLNKLLGTSIKARGKDRRPFHLRGTFADMGQLAGDASLAWQSLTAYGFDVGASHLDAKLDRGTLAGSPVQATFGRTGVVKLTPSLQIKPNTYDLTFAKGRIIEKATLTPAVCADALGYALPAIAKSTKADGTISFDLDDHRVPLTNIERVAMKGKLTLHDVSVTPGPVIAVVMELLGQSSSKSTLAKDQVVNVKVENGRVHHDKLELAAGNVAVSTGGSVGFDGSLALTVQVPLPESAVGPLLKNLPKIKDAVANKRIAVPLTGTLEKPKLDRAAFQAEVAKFVREVTKDAAKGKLEELLPKVLEPPKKP